MLHCIILHCEESVSLHCILVHCKESVSQHCILLHCEESVHTALLFTHTISILSILHCVSYTMRGVYRRANLCAHCTALYCIERGIYRRGNIHSALFLAALEECLPLQGETHFYNTMRGKSVHTALLFTSCEGCLLYIIATTTSHKKLILL